MRQRKRKDGETTALLIIVEPKLETLIGRNLYHSK